jgi:hypothetical protein
VSVGVAADWHSGIGVLLQGEVDLVGKAGGDQLPSRNALLQRVGRALASILTAWTVPVGWADECVCIRASGAWRS